MASIRCKACGKTYDYRKEGFCPKCGAYNRPPRQEWVDAQGGIHYAGQEKECYERKECHEEKVCYEQQTRRPKPYIRQHVPKKGIIGAVIAVIVIIIQLNLVRGCVANDFGSIFGGKEELTPNYPDYGWEQEAPAEEIESTVREYAEIGASFYLEDSAFVVAYTELDHENLSLLAYVVEEGDYQTFPDLIWVDDDGFENWCYPEDVVVSDTDDNVFICTYDLSYAPHDNMWLVFYGVDKEVWVGIESTI